MRIWSLILSLMLMSCTSRRDEVVVFAASSLQEVFSSLGRTFEAEHPGVSVSFSFAGSQELRTQIEHGAKPDVFASADRVHMQAVEDARLVAPSRAFARNELVFVVNHDEIENIHRTDNLAQLERISLGGPDVPLGRYTRLLFVKLSQSELGPSFVEAIESHVVSHELSARQVVARVSLGEAQGGVVYRTDAKMAGSKLSVVPLPLGTRVVAEYSIAALASAPHRTRAEEWVAFVVSPVAQQRLHEAGFLPVTRDDE